MVITEANKLLTVRQLMHGATMVQPTTSVHEVATLMRDKSIGSVLVRFSEIEYGIVTERDLVYKVAAENLDPKTVKAKDVMTELRYTIDANASIQRASEIFSRHSIRRLPVMEDGMIIGIITARDVAKASIFQHMKSGRGLGQ